MGFVMLLKLVGPMKFIFISFDQYSMEIPKFRWFLEKKKITIGMQSEIYWLISFKLGIMIDTSTSKLYSLIQVRLSVTFI